MAITKFLARDLSIQINTGTEGTPVWTDIGGLNTLTHSPTSTDADTTDFDSAGVSEHMKAERGESWTLAGFGMEDVSNGDRDPGQEAVETLAALMGPASLDEFLLTSPGGNTARFSASAEVTRMGGGNNDPAAWQAVIRVSGAVVYA